MANFWDSDDSDFDDLDDLDSYVPRRTYRTEPGRASSVRYSKSDLRRLYQKAESYANSHSTTKHICRTFYRDKSREYFDNILTNQHGIMEVYMKDFHGDPKSPSNGRIKGLFFSANQNNSGSPPSQSIYGKRRILIPTNQIYELSPNAYFTDFYCINGNSHYVTLVFTRPGTSADLFCQQQLIPFQLHNNPFLSLSSGTFRVNNRVWVEILVTENINIPVELTHGASWDDVTMTGQKSGGSTGLLKSATCTECNL